MKIFFTLGIGFALMMSAPSAYAGKTSLVSSGRHVPYIGNDEKSVEYLVEAIVMSIVASFDLDGSDEKNLEEASEANFQRYASELAKTLSQLSPSEQNIVWYGS